MEPDGRNGGKWETVEAAHHAKPTVWRCGRSPRNAIVRKGRVGFESMRRALRLGDPAFGLVAGASAVQRRTTEMDDEGQHRPAMLLLDECESAPRGAI
jgi:hypothetical protein